MIYLCDEVNVIQNEGPSDGAFTKLLVTSIEKCCLVKETSK